MKLVEIEGLLNEAISAHDFSRVERIARIAARVKELDAERAALVAELHAPEANGSFSAPANLSQTSSPMERSSARGGLQVQLRLPQKKTIFVNERTASDTVVAVMERLLPIVKYSGLEELTSVRVSRGPLISKCPDRDFRNAKTGTLYAHHRIPGTDLYVLTHSSTAEKVADLKTAFAKLGMPESAFQITVA
jgi:hypothetical protein